MPMHLPLSESSAEETYLSADFHVYIRENALLYTSTEDLESFSEVTTANPPSALTSISVIG